MKAALYRGSRRIEMVEIELPTVGDDEVMVKIAYAGICGSDLHVFKNERLQSGFAGSHEITGEIIAVGAIVDGLSIGDRIVVEPLLRCGCCRYCLSGRYNLCDRGGMVGRDAHGGFAEYAVVPAYTCFPLPDEVSYERAVLIEPLAVAIRAIRAARVGGGDSVVILGSGAIGLMGILAARAAGAERIIVTAKHEHQVAAAEQFGATQVVVAGDSITNETIARLLNGAGADVVVETVGGSAPTVSQALRLVRKGGTIVLVGLFSAPQPVQINSLVLREINMIGAFCYDAAEPRRDFQLAMDIATGDLNGGGIALERMITHRFSLSEIQKAFDTAADKSTGAIKVVVAQ